MRFREADKFLYPGGGCTSLSAGLSLRSQCSLTWTISTPELMRYLGTVEPGTAGISPFPRTSATWASGSAMVRWTVPPHFWGHNCLFFTPIGWEWQLFNLVTSRRTMIVEPVFFPRINPSWRASLPGLHLHRIGGPHVNTLCVILEFEAREQPGAGDQNGYALCSSCEHLCLELLTSQHNTRTKIQII